ncbi:MAG: hypothetical protein EZS28_048959, partial [Streblomastix strix]
MTSLARRLAEIVRATLDLQSVKTDIINLNTEALKYFQESRNDDGKILWWNVAKERTATPEYCSRLRKQVLAVQ